MNDSQFGANRFGTRAHNLLRRKKAPRQLRNFDDETALATTPRETAQPTPESKTVNMSRFFTASDSSSEESSEEELYSEEEESEQEESEENSEDDDSGDDDDDDSSSGSELGANKFLRDASESEDSDDEDRVKSLKSAKTKRFDELEGTVRQMENALKINDWAVVSTGEFTQSTAAAVRLTDGRVRQVEPPNPRPDQAE